MANETITGSGNADDIYYAAVIADRILDELRPYTTSREFLRWEPAGNSPSADFPIASDPGPASALTEGTNYTTFTELTTTKATAVAAEVGFMSLVSDVLEKVSLMAVTPYVSKWLARSVAEKWETDVAALMDDFTSTSNTTVASSTLTPDDLLRAVSSLEQRDIPGPFVAYLDPKQTGELRRELAQTTAVLHTGGNDMGGIVQPHTSGFFGSLYGIPIWQTSLVVTTSGLVGGAVFADKQALGAYELWGPRVELQRDASYRGTEVVVTQCYGLIEISDTRGQTVQSVA